MNIELFAEAVYTMEGRTNNYLIRRFDSWIRETDETLTRWFAFSTKLHTENFWRICGFNVRSRNQYLQHLHWQISSGVHISFFRVLSLSGTGWYNDIVHRSPCKHDSCQLSRPLMRKTTRTTHKERDAHFFLVIFTFFVCVDASNKSPILYVTPKALWT